MLFSCEIGSFLTSPELRGRLSVYRGKFKERDLLGFSLEVARWSRLVPGSSAAVPSLLPALVLELSLMCILSVM